MGIKAGSITTTRYKMAGEISAETIFEGIKKHRFHESEDHESEYSIGWTSSDNYFLPDYDKIFNVAGFVVFALRIDKKTIPVSVVKKHVALESARRLKDPDKTFLTKAEKKEIKEQVTNFIASKMPLKPEMYDVLIDLAEGLVSIFTSSKSACDDFETLFFKSFGIRLIRLFPFTLAAHRSELEDQEMLFGSPRGLDASVAYAKHKQLGSDFLTWIWYKLENNPLNIFGPMTHMLDLSDKRKISLENSSTKDAESTVIKNDGDNLKEAFVSLSKGARVTQLGLKLNINDSYWIFNLKDKDLSPVSMKMPRIALPESKEDEHGAMLERIGLYSKATEAIEEAFSHFVAIWSDDSKKANEIGNIDKWIKRELN